MYMVGNTVFRQSRRDSDSGMSCLCVYGQEKNSFKCVKLFVLKRCIKDTYPGTECYL